MNIKAERTMRPYEKGLIKRFFKDVEYNVFEKQDVAGKGSCHIYDDKSDNDFVFHYSTGSGKGSYLFTIEGRKMTIEFYGHRNSLRSGTEYFGFDHEELKEMPAKMAGDEISLWLGDIGLQVKIIGVESSTPYIPLQNGIHHEGKRICMTSPADLSSFVEAYDEVIYGIPISHIGLSHPFDEVSISKEDGDELIFNDVYKYMIEERNKNKIKRGRM